MSVYRSAYAMLDSCEGRKTSTREGERYSGWYIANAGGSRSRRLSDALRENVRRFEIRDNENNGPLAKMQEVVYRRRYIASSQGLRRNARKVVWSGIVRQSDRSSHVRMHLAREPKAFGTSCTRVRSGILPISKAGRCQTIGN